MTVRASGAGLLVTLFAVLTPTAAGQDVPHQRRGSTQLAKDEAIRLALGRTVGEITYDKTPVGEVFKDLRKRLGVNLHVQWQIFDDAGLEPDKPITLKLKRVPLARVLRLVLEEFGGTDLRCRYEIRDGVLVISTAESLGWAMTTRAHSVRDLLPDVRAAGTAAKADPEYARCVSELVMAVVDAVYPDAWAQNGGLGTVQFRDGLLVVHNTPNVQSALEALLATLRRLPKHGRAAVPPARDNPPPQDRAIQSALQRVLPTVFFDGAPLDGAIDKLRRQLDINIHAHWQTLEDAGVERDALVRMTLANVTAARVLRQIFDDFSDVRLAYRIDDGVLIISSAEDLNQRRDIWVYDVRDVAKSAEDPDDLAQLIVDTVEPDSWMQNGGCGTLQFVAHRLVVRNHEPAHRKLSLLLELLRKRAFDVKPPVSP